MAEKSSMPLPFKPRRLIASDAESYRWLRLEALRSHPEAFSASWADEMSKPLSWFVERLEHNFVLAGLRDDVAVLGVAGLTVPEAMKTRHKGILWGMFVLPEARGTGLASALVAGVIAQAKTVVEEVRLSVVTSNTAAVRLYSRAGFVEYGLERRSLKVDDCYYDDLLMALQLSNDGGTPGPHST